MNIRYLKFLEVTKRESPVAPKMYEFIIWINEQWREWRTMTGNKQPHGEVHHKQFDMWLENK